MQGTCDHCGKGFNVEIKEKKHPKKIIETYFRCSNCKHKYVCFVKDEKVRRLQEEIKTEKSPFKRYAMQQKINTRMKKLKESIVK